MLLSEGLERDEINKVIGDLLSEPWEMIFVPGAPEYPGDRVWNTGHAQAPAEPINALLRFIAQAIRHTPGHKIPFKEFYGRFILSLPLAERSDWSRVRVSRELPSKHPSRRCNANVAFVMDAGWAE
jgi:hypothetical protein